VKPAGTLSTVAAVAGEAEEGESDETEEVSPVGGEAVGELIGRLTLGEAVGAGAGAKSDGAPAGGKGAAAAPEPYAPITATPTARLGQLTIFRAVHPLYGLFLMAYLGQADDSELIQILESLLEMPGTVARHLRVPRPEELPPGPLGSTVLDPALLTRGLATQEDLYPPADQSDVPPELRKYPIPLAQKMRMLFESEIDHAGGLFITPVWAVGDLLAHGGDFDKFVRLRDLVKQEGILFKHALRMILLCGEFAQLTPREVEAEAWKAKLNGMAATLTAACRAVDPQSTDELLEEMEEEA
jgi:hypothetical protein